MSVASTAKRRRKQAVLASKGKKASRMNKLREAYTAKGKTK